jgi:DNA polymerase-1
MRIAAHLSGDESMIRELGPGGDIHENTIRQIFATELARGEPTVKRRKDMRLVAKTVNFGVAYGMAGHGLLKRTPTLGLTIEQADSFIKGVYDAYPGWREWQLDTIKFCKINGYAETMMGRRRYFPDITSRDFEKRGEAERGAINHPIQGSAADYFKTAALRVYRFMKASNCASKIIALVHDEIVIEAPDGEVQWLAETIPAIMASAVTLKVPVFVDFEFGQSWGTVKGFDPDKHPYPRSTWRPVDNSLAA